MPGPGRLARWLAFLCAAALIGACGRSDEASRTEPRPGVAFGAYAGDSSALVYIADQQGYFREQGLDLTLRGFESGKQAADALLAGDVDVATSADFVFVSNVSARSDLRILASVAEVENYELVARRDRGVRTLADLQGKRVGVHRKSAAEFMLGNFLVLNGLKVEDVALVDLTPLQQVEAIVEGRVDAACTFVPHVDTMKQRLGERAISWPAQAGAPYYFLLLSTRERLERKPPFAQPLLRALLKAQEYAEKNPGAAKQLIGKRLGLETAYLERSWPQNRFTVAMPQTLLLVLEAQGRWQSRQGPAPAVALQNYLDYLDTGTLTAVAHNRVSVAR